MVRIHATTLGRIMDVVKATCPVQQFLQEKYAPSQLMLGQRPFHVMYFDIVGHNEGV
jgi:hypothetical protein